jgi:hypothetical protein
MDQTIRQTRRALTNPSAAAAHEPAAAVGADGRQDHPAVEADLPIP